MQQHNLTQGSAAWLAHRAACWNASDCPAMLGCSPYEQRSSLIRRLATGITPDVDAGTQRLFDAGHRFEALARPRAEVIVGDDLSPLSGSVDIGLSRPLAASFDGITFMGDTVFEHKTMSEALRYTPWDEGNGDHLPKHFRAQMEHQLIVSGAERCLFMATKWDGDMLVEERHCWYASDPALRAEILAGWKQLEADVCAYQPPEPAAPVVIAQPVASLPVVFDMRVEGRLVSCNLEKYKPAALAYIEAINTELTTDQHFADADADAKFCRESATKLETSIELALGQMGDINAAISTVREIAAAFNAKGLALEKLVKSEKDRRKTVIVMERQAALREHCDGLTKRVGVPVSVGADFAGVIKGLKSIASMEDKLDTELARAKIEASRLADLIYVNGSYLDEAEARHLFPDFAQVCTKPAEDFCNLVISRQAAAQARIEAERERIRAEEAARLEREQRAEAERKAREDAEAKAAAERAARITEAQGAQQVLKAEPETADATDRAVPAITSPSVGSMGAGQPADAGPVAGVAPAPEVRTFARAAAPAELPTMTLGQISTRLGFTVTADFLASLGFEAHKEKASRLYRPSAFPAICQAISAHVLLLASEARKAA